MSSWDYERLTCQECQGMGETIDVIEVKDGNEVAEDE